MEILKRKKNKEWKQKLEKELRLQAMPRSDILTVVMLICNEEDMQSVVMSDSFLLQIYGLENEPHRDKTGFLPMRKQRRRSAWR